MDAEHFVNTMRWIRNREGKAPAEPRAIVRIVIDAAPQERRRPEMV